jgi:hypothetical protein
MNGVAYYILALRLVKHEGRDSVLGRAFGKDGKTLGSIAAYALAVLASPFFTPLSLLLYALVAALWLIPDRRIEKALTAG